MQPENRLLAHAHRLIASSWTQEAEARNASGDPVDPCDPDAVSWSLLGALVSSYERFVWIDGATGALEELAKCCVFLAEVIDSDSLPHWNDAPERTQADVLSALDQALGRKPPGR